MFLQLKKRVGRVEKLGYLRPLDLSSDVISCLPSPEFEQIDHGSSGDDSAEHDCSTVNSVHVKRDEQFFNPKPLHRKTGN